MSRIEISARHDGAAVDTFDLVHGEDPQTELARRGWSVVAPVCADRLRNGALRITVDVVPAPPRSSTDPSATDRSATDRSATDPRATDRRATDPTDVPSDADLVVAPGETPHEHQRVASYALVQNARGILLTQLADNVVGAGGLWALPGGGLDDGEDPRAGAIREVWEETGQHIDAPELVDVVTARWIGRAPNGRLEDFHAIRLIHRADCPDPSDPVVHDVGGSTARSQWFTPGEVAQLPLTAMVAERWRDWFAAG